MRPPGSWWSVRARNGVGPGPVRGAFDDEDEPWQRVRVGLVALATVLAGGTVAYRIVGLGWLDAFYQTVITVTTVGYGEVPPADGEIDAAYRAVTSVLILGGVSVGVYTLGVFFEALIDGRLNTHLGRVRMQRELDKLSGHIVVCGHGRVGEAVAAEMARQGTPVVVIDRADDIHEQLMTLTVQGDATDDDVLLAAGIERARGLVTALDTDADNLFVTISARAINPTLHIVSRVIDASSEAKLLAGGADRVVNPHRIGGVRMASFITQPNVADFVGESMHDARFEVRLSETVVEEGGPLDHRPLAESDPTNRCGVTVLAVRRPDGSFVHQPGPDTVLRTGDVVIALGTSDQQAAFRTWAGTR